MRIITSLAMLAVAIGGAAHAQEISETLATKVRATLASPRSPVELELCVADAISRIGGAVPVPIRKGDGSVLMLGYGHTPKLIVTLAPIQNGTRLEIQTRGGDMDDKLVSYIKSACEIS